LKTKVLTPKFLLSAMDLHTAIAVFGVRQKSDKREFVETSNFCDWWWVDSAMDKWPFDNL